MENEAMQDQRRGEAETLTHDYSDYQLQLFFDTVATKPDKSSD